MIDHASSYRKTIGSAGVVVCGVVLGVGPLLAACGTSSPASTSTPHPTVTTTTPSAAATTATSRDPAAAGMPAGVDGPFLVTTVVDGDTVKVDEVGSAVTVRLVGMDTPETKDPRKPVQCYGPEASAHAGSVLGNKTVYLEYDPSQGRTDKYGRTLAYLWLPGATLYNQAMIREGYAHEYTYGQPYKYQAQFRAAEQAARTARIGLWNPTTCNGNTTQVKSTPTSTPKPTPTPTHVASASTPPPAYVPPATTAPATYYANCAAAKAAGAAPLYVGQPGYRSGLDRDGDGVACES